MTALKSLAESNAERGAIYQQYEAPKPHPNGIACPECGAELVDSHPMTILPSSPPQKNVACLACGWTGYRVA